MATIDWSVQSITILPSVDELTDFEWKVVATCTVTNDTNTQSASIFAQFDPAQQSGAYTPYNQLTETQVLDWVFAYVGPSTKNNTESNLLGSINAQVAPLPWVAPETAPEEVAA